MIEISTYLIATGLAWLVAQGTKYILSAKTGLKRNVRSWYLSGNMPSAHTATMVALMTTVGLRDGVESGLFAVVATLTAMTMYDSMMSRRAVGEQGLALRRLLALSKHSKDPLPYHALGHKPLEVAVGAAVGFVVALAVDFLITK